MRKEALEESVLRQLGDPAAVAREMADFRKAAKSLSSQHPRFIDEYPKQWIVVYEGKVRARGETMESALHQAEAQHVPIRHAIVRYIDRNERTFIL